MIWLISVSVLMLCLSICMLIGGWLINLTVTPLNKDREASPWLSRLAIPLGLLIPLSRQLLSSKRQRHIEAQLLQAGLQYRFNALNFFNFQLFWALLAALLSPFLILLIQCSWWWLPLVTLGVTGVAWILPLIWLRDHIKVRHQQVALALPFVLDMVTLCVEAGLNFQSGLALTAERAPSSALKQELGVCLAEIRTGVPRSQALKNMSTRVNETSLKTWLSMVIHAEQLGVSLGPLMRTQAEQRRSERFLNAEKLALQAPVKMLFPIALCIFPCTFIVLGLPMVMQLWPHL